MQRCTYSCNTADHGLSRRAFLGASTAAALGPSGFANAYANAELAKTQKRVLVIFLAGGASQLETWDPKPNTDTGGPFKAIPTSVPGTHIGELLPYTAKQMHRLAIVRGLNSVSDDHGIGEKIMLTGRKPEPAVEYPHIGAVAAKLLGNSAASALPGHIQILPKGSSGFGKADATFLGPKFGSVSLGDGKPPADLLRPANMTAESDAAREDFRRKLNDRFAKSRKSAATDAYAESFEQAERVVKQGEVFDIEKEDPKVADRYGRHDLGRHFLLARRLLEAGVTYVKVSHSNYDTHHENFDFHIEQLGEFDRPFAALMDDLAARGMLETTLVIVMSEMGRTPKINANYGRDHWSRAWSVALGGCGIKGGAVVGKTNANGTVVTDREVYSGHLFHTYLQAVGLDSSKSFHPNDRPIPIADPKTAAISEILA
ncbi:MAG: DUF1501 domain-containing protein [Planctomycetes bacterium]|nr:DUF1501 domain-containing protein [Planctomycetota bacterium]